jgi:hypothetical protein
VIALSTQAKEIQLTKELAKRIKLRFPDFKVYANKCPSRCREIKVQWEHSFGEPCPPLQPEIDLIMYEPMDDNVQGSQEKVRAIEIKYYRKKQGSINQSFYKGIEQALALLQWGFDNVALWQLFDESFSEEELWDYGARTWIYVHGRLDIPIEYTMFKVIKSNSAFKFEVINPDWNNYPIILNLGLIEELKKWNHTHPNPFINGELPPKMKMHPLGAKSIRETSFLRNFIIQWLKSQKEIS